MATWTFRISDFVKIMRNYTLLQDGISESYIHARVPLMCQLYDYILSQDYEILNTYSEVVLMLQHIEADMMMMTSSNGNIFRVTGHLCGDFTED